MYQMTKLARSGDHSRKELMRDRIETWESEHAGPICCFFTRQRERVGASDQDGYVNLSDYILPDCPDDEVVIGCSRGCVPISAQSTYGPILCEPCVREAKEYLDNLGSDQP